MLTIMIERWETLSIIGLIVGGKLIREVSHGSHRTTSGNHSHCGSCFLPCTTKRVQITEVRLTQLVRHLRSNYYSLRSRALGEQRFSAVCVRLCLWVKNKGPKSCRSRQQLGLEMLGFCRAFAALLLRLKIRRGHPCDPPPAPRFSTTYGVRLYNCILQRTNLAPHLTVAVASYRLIGGVRQARLCGKRIGPIWNEVR